MPREARLANGDVLRFPDDTPDDVMDKAVHEYLHPVPGPGIAPHANPPMEKSLLGTAYETGKEAISQAGKLAKGAIETLTPVAAIKGMRGAVDMMRGDYTPPPNMITEPIKQQMLEPTDKPVMQRFADTTAALMDGDPDRAKQIMAESGSILPAMIAYAGIPLVGFLLGGIGKATKRIPNNTLNLKSAESATALIDPSAIRPTFKPLKAAGISPIHMPDNVDVMTGAAIINRPALQQAAKQLNISPDIFAATEKWNKSDPMGRIKPGGKAALDVTDLAVKNMQKPIDGIVNIYASDKVPEVRDAIVATLKNELSNTLDDAAAGALQKLIDKVETKPPTVRELNELKVYANHETSKLLSSSQAAQIEAPAHVVSAYRELGDAIRQHLYPYLESRGASNIAELGTRESAAIIMRDGVATTYFKIVPEQAKWAAKGYFSRVKSGSLYKTHVARRLLNMELSPMGEFNQLFKQALGDIAPDFVPEQLGLEVGTGFRTPINRQLPSTTGNFSPAGKFEFTLPSGNNVLENLSETKVSGSIKNYAGTKEVPYKRHEPLGPQPPPEGTSHFRQRQQLGVTAETIPERVRGKMTPSKARADQLGSTQAALPERAFTGPETVTESQWTYAEPPREIGQLNISGPGVMRTTDPAIAVKTLADITKRLKDPKLPAELRSQLLAAQESLTKQLQIYRTYENFQAPPSVKLNITPAKLGTKRKISPSAVAAKSARPLATGMIANREKE